MSKKLIDICGSIVVYNQSYDDLKPAIDSFLNTELNVRLFLIDNSPKKLLRKKICDLRIFYKPNDHNIGFGKAHNKVIKSTVGLSKYHLVLNPDVYFEKGNLEKMFNYMELNPDVGQLMPKVLYPNNELQYVCKLLPRPSDLFLRRFLPLFSSPKYALRNFSYSRVIDIPNLSGCFMFLRAESLKKVGLFDPVFFMYLEDVDLTRRMNAHYRTIFFPNSEIFHKHEKASFKSMKLLLIHIKSAIYYFNKYGWFQDSERKRINKKVINNLLNNH